MIEFIKGFLALSIFLAGLSVVFIILTIGV